MNDEEPSRIYSWVLLVVLSIAHRRLLPVQHVLPPICYHYHTRNAAPGESLGVGSWCVVSTPPCMRVPVLLPMYES